MNEPKKNSLRPEITIFFKLLIQKINKTKKVGVNEWRSVYQKAHDASHT